MARFVNPDNSAFQISLNSEIYVDKSELIKYTNSIIETSDAYICDSRPRRFGKSYAANMLSAYYSKGADSFEMFRDLKIGSDTGFKQYLNRYDVIQIDVQWFISVCNCRSEIVSYISSIVIEELRKVYPDAVNDSIYFLSNVLSQIYEKTGNRFVVIIDQWDAVLRDSAFSEIEKSEYIHFIQSLVGGLEPSKYIALAWLTEILPVKEENNFLLNNFHQFTMLNSGPLAQFKGFTEDEVSKLCLRYHQDFSLMKKWYGGYLLNGYELFCPKAVCSHLCFYRFNCYWSSTASYEVITDLLSMNGKGLETVIKEILAGTEVRVSVIDTNTCKDVLNYLVHLGYLGFDENRNTVFVPNEDVRNSWLAATQ